MKLIVDAGPLVAQMERGHAGRVPAKEALSREPGLPVLSPLTAAEVDYLCQAKAGKFGNRPFIADLAAGRFEIAPLGTPDFAEIERLNNRYRDLNPGIADLSLIVLAARYRTTRLLTFDQRHFRLMRPLQGGAFTLLPFDEDIE